MKEIVKVEHLDKEKLFQYLDLYGYKSLTDKEKNIFVEVSMMNGLNPFKREIHISKFGDNFSVITGYEVYIKRAEKSGLLDGWQVTTEGSIKDNNLRAIITIHRKDLKYEFVHDVWYTEYAQKTKEGKVTRFWADKPITMIKKVAIAQGFRMCFSAELAGMPYTADEVEQQTETVNVEVIELEKKQPVKLEKAIETPAKKKIPNDNFKKGLELLKTDPFNAIKTMLKFDLSKDQIESANKVLFDSLKDLDPNYEGEMIHIKSIVDIWPLFTKDHIDYLVDINTKKTN
jgi:phage recombination protein Bet